MILFRLLIMLGESNTYPVPHRERSEWIYSSQILMDMHRKDPDTRITNKSTNIEAKYIKLKLPDVPERLASSVHIIGTFCEVIIPKGR